MSSVRTLSPAAAVLLIAGAASAQIVAVSDQTAPAGVNVSHDFSGTVIPLNADLWRMTGGGAIGDFNKDGFQDIFFLSGGAAPDRLFINNQDGTFADQAAAWGVAANQMGCAAVAGDYNKDGWIDIFVANWGPGGSNSVLNGHRLYRNNGNGTFTDVAAAAGVAQTSPDRTDGFGAAWGDYDLDGDLDLIVSGWRDNSFGNRLFRNNGNETFTDVTVAAFNSDLRFVKGFSPKFVDMDGDRYPEVLWAADFGSARYYINNRDGTFTDHTMGVGCDVINNAMGNEVADFNNDGLFDWYVTNVYAPPPDDVSYIGNTLWINDGGHSYTEIAEESGTQDGGWGWGVGALDVNHDGWLDIVETNGWMLSSIHNGVPSKLWISNGPDGGDLTFDEVGAAAGLTFAGQGRGLARLDYDNDGDQDFAIFACEQQFHLFRNDLSGDDINWLRIFLDTTNAPGLAPQGAGSRVSITVGADSQHRVIDLGDSYLVNHEPSAHFGLGAAATVDRVEVLWNNGAITVLTDVPANQTITISAASACIADWNGLDGANSEDFMAYITDFLNGNLRANIDGRPKAFDSDDFIHYLISYSAGCPR